VARTAVCRAPLACNCYAIDVTAGEVMTRRLATAQVSHSTRPVHLFHLTNHESQLRHVVMMAVTSFSRPMTSHTDTGAVVKLLRYILASVVTRDICLSETFVVYFADIRHCKVK